MQKMRVRDRDYTKSALFAACALLVGLLAFTFKQGTDVATLNTRLSGIYQKAFYETCELMEGMSANLRKLLVTGSAQQEQMLLAEISRQAQGAQDDLAILPLARTRFPRRSSSSTRPATSRRRSPGGSRAAARSRRPTRRRSRRSPRPRRSSRSASGNCSRGSSPARTCSSTPSVRAGPENRTTRRGSSGIRGGRALG